MTARLVYEGKLVATYTCRGGGGGDVAVCLSGRTVRWVAQGRR